MVDLLSASWVLLAVGAFIIGVSKTAAPGAGPLVVALFAAVLPARPSTAVVLMLLIVGDLFAIWAYRRDVDWSALRRLVPTVIVGMVVGAFFLWWADDLIMRRSIAVILLALTLATLLLMRKGSLTPDSVLGNPRIRGAYGVMGGFTTMAANAGGPVMMLYFLAARFDVMKFMGTQAWFFFVVNVTKVPFSIGIGLLTTDMIPMLLSLVPFVVIGAILGRIWLRRIPKKFFDRVVITLTIISAVWLLR